MREVVVAGVVRTAIGKFGGTLAGVGAVDLGAVVIREALKRARVDPSDVSEVIMGHVLQAGTGLCTARQAALKAGMPISVPAFTVNKVCASGLKAVALAAAAVAAGEYDIAVAGGMENMSAAPFLLTGTRWGQKLGDAEALDVILRDALTDPTEGCHMGITAENLARKFAISRADQDAFAAESQRKAADAFKAGRFGPEIAPVSVPQKKGSTQVFDADEFPRGDTTIEVLGRLRPAFDPAGTVTAGNASGINDGAAALVVLAADVARARGIEPLARINASASAGVSPLEMGLGPVAATRAVLEKAGLTMADVDAVELNEAFAAQSLAVVTELGLPLDKVNMNGGAIALGHPVGCSGARILVTLVHILRDRGLSRGLATLCIGGGQGMAMLVERA